jgi:hypothetical protein
VAEFLDDAADAHQLRRRIVDDQDTGHAVFPLKTGSIVAVAPATANGFDGTRLKA